ncbi:hypothetical protein [Deinococcus sp. AJ005]|uniref:hypothetical protein n=1 Tax=Deinococcus sp. AJ005 TaxID=2652443 RepID=UPI00125CC395|nr:hypothetical protein [Deinococcus sp. AJ005]QFP77606.1 hypothetical protein DAAJ005_14950 [Deinococcus sp. AJ005]
MIRSFDSGRRWNLQKSTVLGSPELHEFRPAPLQSQTTPLQFCPESLNRALLAEENRQTLKLVGRLRWATQTAKN